MPLRVAGHFELPLRLVANGANLGWRAPTARSRLAVENVICLSRLGGVWRVGALTAEDAYRHQINCVSLQHAIPVLRSRLLDLLFDCAPDDDDEL
jgi:hypothetical protein